MAFTSDEIVERRRLRRRLTVWRLVAIVAVGIAIITAAWRVTAARGGPASLIPHIARVSISGVITGDRETIKLIEDLTKSQAAGVLVEIDSPGGTTAGAERLYDALRRLSAKKPTVAVVRTLAASGGYIAAIGTDYIVAEGNSLVGSIGVLFQFPNFAEALDKLGIKVETIKSAPLKASPNGFEPTSPAAKAAIDALVVDSYDWFKGLVRERRQLDPATLAMVSDGRVFTGRQGIGLHLVDAIGEERDAVAWLETKRGVAKDLPVLDWQPSSGLSRFGLFGLAGQGARALGLGRLAGLIDALSQSAETQSLDGLLAIWHVSASE
jgi:protease-4